ncbi:DEAD/DEAH box helicase [Mycoplasmopsis lipofaciens]|uniref:DEAD/DEAH box helicase n=1 Tax=Mycoplasmopsis lipofaciens TaxID=114884 RepID=UPI00048701AF|nr:DEAD/DEAH box helicase [Mycoplasmopsis lipofaciens]
MFKLTLEDIYTKEFTFIFNKALKHEKLTLQEWNFLLSVAILCIRDNNWDQNVKKLGYRILLIYGVANNDYIPLYEYTENEGYYPISEFIGQKLNYFEKYGNLYTAINNFMNEKYIWNDSYKTEGQYNLYKYAEKSIFDSQIIVAPTSYGKTELILDFIDNENFSKICIITPTKSLLAQTKKRIIDRFENKKIIVHSEMYNKNDEKFIVILTQERLLKLLQKNLDLKFDLLIIDEAHNLFSKFKNKKIKDTRSIILFSVITICNKRNENLICKYLSPFINSSDSLNSDYNKQITNFYNVNENIKSEMFYFHDLKNKTKYFLDQFSTLKLKDKLIKIDDNYNFNDFDVILDNKDLKNLIYLNKGKDIEDFAKEFASKISLIKNNNKIDKAIQDLKSFVHEDYDLINCLKKGIIYHHGSVPDAIRLYIEKLYTDVPEINFLVANSTLLEGVNLSLTKMFILDIRKGNEYLKGASLKNLIGRICRFSDIFHDTMGDLKYLLPEIHFVHGKYFPTQFNIDNFIKNSKILVTANIEDTIENPLLSNFKLSNSKEIDRKNEAELILKNISSSDNIGKNYVKKPVTEIGKLCFENNINIFNIIETEEKIDNILKSLSTVNTVEDAFEIMDKLFFSNMDENNEHKIKRLKKENVKNFYVMLIKWKINSYSFKDMITSFLSYWDKKIERNESFVFVNKWGETDSGYIDIANKTRKEKINLIIIRIKEEYEFIEFEILKYIEVLNSLNLIDESLYLKIKYGTDDKNDIALLKCGISGTLSKLLKAKYSNFFKLNVENNTILFKKDLISEMEKNNENGILISEVKLNIKE